MQEKYNDTGFILVPAKEAIRPAEREALYYLHRVLVVGDTSLSERGREAPKSLGVLGVTEASANIGCSGSVCSCRRPSFRASLGVLGAFLLLL